MRLAWRTAFAVTAICASIAAPALAAPPGYRVTDLGASAPGIPFCAPFFDNVHLVAPSSAANALTNRDLVVGDYRYHCDFSREGFLVNGSSFDKLPRFRPDWGFGFNASALDVNEDGTIAGWSNNQGGSGGRPVAWVDGQLDELGWLGLPAELDPIHTRLGYALGVDDDGTIVGSSITDSGAYHPFRSDGQAMTDLGVPRGYTHAAAVAIADSGAIAINAGDDERVAAPDNLDGASRAFLLRKGRLRKLAAFRGGSAAATDVNETSTVVGWSLTGANERHAVLWNGLAVRDLGPGRALAVNEARDVVGVTGAEDAPQAFLYRNGRRYRLDDLLPRDAGWHITMASDINDRGHIVGVGIRAGLAAPQAVLLTPGR